MSWARLDDRFASHPKVRRLRARYGIDAYAALGWWFLQLADTIDGTIDREASVVAYPEVDPDLIVPMLIDVGLIDTLADGRWAIHDWADYQTDTTLQRLGGKARAASGKRDPKTGQLLPQQAGQQAASLPSSPVHSTPVSPAGKPAELEHAAAAARAVVASLGLKS